MRIQPSPEQSRAGGFHHESATEHISLRIRADSAAPVNSALRDLLARAIKTGHLDGTVASLKTDPEFKALRKLTRFASLVNR